IWWPCRQEFWFDERFQEKSGVIPIHALSTDVSELVIDEWHLQAEPVESRVTDLRWKAIKVMETITITNPSSTHAVIGAAALEGDEWLLIPLTPPPGVGAEELTG